MNATVRKIITASPAAWLNTFGVRNALIAAAEQGNANMLKLICESGGGQIRQCINAGASKGQAPLMRACMYGSPQHVECVAYLLVHGADVYAQTSRGDNVVHIAAKHGNAGCLHALLSSRPQADSEGGTVLLGDVLVQGDAGPTKLIDLHNGSGLTALHLAAIKGSVAVVRALVRAGASLDAPTLSGVLNPNLSRGSTSLHIAAARGHAACVSALLESQAAVPGMELQRVRNARGLKASQLARLAGHHSVARLLAEAHIVPALSGGHSFADTPRQPRRSAHGRPEQQQQMQQRGSRGGSAAPERPQVSQEAVIGAIVQRAKLLLSLRAVTLQTEPGSPTPRDAASEEAALTAVAAEVSEALRSKGPNGQPTESLSTLLGLLASLTDSTSPVAQQYIAASAPSAAIATSSDGSQAEASAHASASQSPEMSAAAAEAGAASGGSGQKHRCATPDDRPQQRATKAYAAGALVQAALNAMAAGVQGPQPLNFLTPTSSAAAALAVQAALKKLSSSRHGARTLASAGLPDQASTSGQLHRQASNMSVRSAVSAASVGGSSSRSGRRHRRQHGLRQTLSGTLTRHGSASEMLSAMTAGHAAPASVSRRRRHSHRRSGSSGSVSALILSPAGPRNPPAPSTPAQPSPSAALQPSEAAARDSTPDALGTAAAPASGHDAAQEAPEEREMAHEHAAVCVGVAGAADGSCEALDSLSEPSEAGTWLPSSSAASPAHLSLLPFKTGEHPAPSHTDTLQLSGICEGRSAAGALDESAAGQTTFPVSELGLQPHSSIYCLSDTTPAMASTHHSPLPCSNALTKSAGHNSTSPFQSQPEDDGAARASSLQSAAMAQLRVRSRLFSISDDVPERVSPYRMAGSPTDPFESAELLGSDSLPSSPFGDSRAADALLHSSDNMLGLASSSGGEAAHSSPDSLFARGRFMQTSDVAELLQTSCSGHGQPSGRGEWGGHGYGAGRWSSHGQESILESCDIEAMLGDDNHPATFVTLNTQQLAPWPAAEPSVQTSAHQPAPLMQPLLEDHDHAKRELSAAAEAAPPHPGSAAAQVAEAFSRRLSFQGDPGRLPAGTRSAVASRDHRVDAHSAAVNAELSSSVDEPDLSRQGSVAPAPRAAAAAVARAFASMATAEKAPPAAANSVAQPAGRSAAVRSEAVDASPGRQIGEALDGDCGLQSERSVPPMPGLAAAQVASAFARLRSSSSSPRDADGHVDGHNSDYQPRISPHQQCTPSPLGCNGAFACGSSVAAPLGSPGLPGPLVASQEASSWGEPAAADLQEAIERSRKDTGGSRSGHDGNAHGAGGATTGPAEARAGRGEGKGSNKHAGKGKERASTKAWTEMCAICMDAGLEISIGGCGHSLCGRCAYQLCARGLAAPVCPFCRGVIQQFEPMAVS